MRRKKRNGLQDGELSSFCMEAALLLHAGVGVGEGLRLLAQEDESGRADLLAAMARRTDGGETLSAAMEAAGVFPDYAVGLTAVGERSGRAEEALRALADAYEERARLSRHIRGALLYPAVLFFLMLAVVAVLLMKVLPVFDEVFASLGGRLTGLAGGLLALGRGMDAAMPALCAVLAAAVAFLAAFAVSDAFRGALLRRWNRRHGDRGLARDVAASRFAQALSMGMRSGLPIEDALRLAEKLNGDNPAAAARCRDCLGRVEKGSGLAEALRDSGALPPSSCSVLALGIRAGTGDTVMAGIARRLNERCGEEIDAKVGRVEPSLVVAASVLVGVILLSVMLPLMNIMAAVG